MTKEISQNRISHLMNPALASGREEDYKAFWDEIHRLSEQDEWVVFNTWVRLFDRDHWEVRPDASGLQAECLKRPWLLTSKSLLIDWSLKNIGFPPLKDNIGLLHYALSWNETEMLKECLAWPMPEATLGSFTRYRGEPVAGEIYLDTLHIEQVLILLESGHAPWPLAPESTHPLHHDMLMHINDLLIQHCYSFEKYWPALIKNPEFSIGDWSRPTPNNPLGVWAPVLGHMLFGFDPPERLNVLRFFLKKLEPYRERPDVASVFKGLENLDSPLATFMESQPDHWFSPIWREYRSKLYAHVLNERYPVNHSSSVVSEQVLGEHRLEEHQAGLGETISLKGGKKRL